MFSIFSHHINLAKRSTTASSYKLVLDQGVKMLSMLLFVHLNLDSVVLISFLSLKILLIFTMGLKRARNAF